MPDPNKDAALAGYLQSQGPRPIKMPASPIQHPVSPEEWELASRYLKHYMRPQPGMHVERNGPLDIQDQAWDPALTGALYSANLSHPGVTNRIGTLGTTWDILPHQGPNTFGTTTVNPRVPADVWMRPYGTSEQNLGNVLHEYSHVMGEPDPGEYPNQQHSAYDVQDLVDMLHQDIDLARHGIRSLFLKDLQSRIGLPPAPLPSAPNAPTR